MTRSRTALGAALVGSLIAAGAVAATSHRTSVSGVMKGSTVTLQGEAQCPPQQRCQPQITATLTLKSGALVKNERRQLSPEAKANNERWEWHEDFNLDDLPVDKTFAGTIEIESSVEVTFRNVTATVR
jgi:hypothetical protein